MTSIAVLNIVLAGLGAASADDSALQAHLASRDKQYDAKQAMLRTKWHSPGYHTTIPSGEWVHPTRESLAYALALLQACEAERVSRAQDIIRKVIGLQDTDPTSKTYGIWSWVVEEPLDKMSPPDWNWADFLGAMLAQMLIEHGAQLDPGLAADMRASLRHAARAIVKRNVGPGYTNIAVMGAGVTLATGEILDDAGLVTYGANRLRRIVEHHDYHGGFNEYNSPTYTVVALHECERILQLIRHEAARANAEKLRRAAWQVIADHFHPATGQWAGPNSRAYRPWLTVATASYLAEQTGVDIRVHPDVGSGTSPCHHLVAGLPCSPDLVDRFRRLPEPEVQVRSRAIRRDSDKASTWMTTWLTPDVCLGSVNHDSFWTQRHVVKAYWNGSDGVPVILRLRFLHDGVDFSSAYVHNVQESNRVLSAVSVVTNRGDFHPSLDRPKDATFEAADFRLRYELAGAEATAKDLGNGRYELAAGPYRAVIHTLPGHFGAYPVAWECAGEEGKAYVDAVCYQGEKRRFCLPDLGQTVLVAGMELIAKTKPPAEAPPTATTSADAMLETSWVGLALRAPTQPH